jgi:site-specific DNA-cytosine methylase
MVQKITFFYLFAGIGGFHQAMHSVGATSMCLLVNRIKIIQ